MTLGNLTAKVGLDTGTLPAQAAKAKAELAGIGQASAGLGGEFGKLGGLASKAFGTVGGAASPLNGVFGALRGSVDSVRGSMSGASSEAGALNSAMGGAAAGAAGLALAVGAFALDGVSKFMTITGEVRKLKSTLGSTAEEASGLRNVAVMLGVDTDTLAKGLFKMSVNLEKSKGDFAGVHVEMAKNTDGTTNLVKTLDNVRAAYQSIHDPTQRNLFLMDSMSKAGMNLRGVMSLTNAEFERFKKVGTIVTDDDLAKSLALARAQREMGAAVSELQVNLARGLVPALTKVAEVTTGVVRWTDEHRQATHFLGEGLKTLATAALPVVGVARLLGIGHKNAGEEAAKHAAQGELLKTQLAGLGVEMSAEEVKTGELTEETKKAKAEAEKYAAKITELASAIGSAYQLMGTATGEVTEATKKEAKAFDEANAAAKLLKQGLDILIGVHISAEAAADNYESRLDSLSKTLAENGKTLDGTTEAGRKNRAGIRDLITATEDEIVAMQREGASNDEVTAKYADHVQALRNTMDAAGYTTAQIDEVINRLGLLAAAPDIEKSITVTTYNRSYTSGQVADNTSQYDRATGFADGGFIDRPMMALIGEAGRELILPLTNMRRTSELLSQAGLIQPFAGPASGGGGMSTTSNRSINNYISVDSPNARDIAREIDWRMVASGGG